MGLMAGAGGKKPRSIPAQEPERGPTPSPVAVDEEVLQKQRARQRQRLRNRGIAGTIITEGGLGEPQTQRATLIGGSA